MSKTVKADHQDGIEHLALVRALSHEISEAISAIEHNDLADLNKRVAAQEYLSEKLKQKHLPSLLLVCESYRTASEIPADTSLRQKIREAHLALAQLSRVYAALIQRSQRSVGLILDLYRNHGQRYTRDASALPAKHTLSCEA